MELHIKIKTIILVFLSSLLLTTPFFAQERPQYLQVDYGIGSIIKHKKILGHLIVDHPEMLSISWQKNASLNEKWKQGFNYPDWGLTLIHQNFKSPKLGKVTALNYTTTYYLRKRNAKHQLNMQVGLGFGYNSNPLDFENNNQNIALSTNFVFAQHLRLGYKYPYVHKNFGVNAGLYFTHFSNAGFKTPNLGINSLFLNAGVNYYLNEARIDYPNIPKKKDFEKQKIHLSLKAQGGFHEAKAGLGSNTVYVFNATAHKRISQKSGLLAGIDFINSQANKDYAKLLHHIEGGYPEGSQLDHKQIGIFVGYHLYFNYLILETSFGYYAYNPLSESPPIYERASLTHKFKNTNFAASLNLRIHYFKAEFFSLGVEYQLF